MGTQMNSVQVLPRLSRPLPWLQNTIWGYSCGRFILPKVRLITDNVVMGYQMSWMIFRPLICQDLTTEQLLTLWTHESDQLQFSLFSLSSDIQYSPRVTWPPLASTRCKSNSSLASQIFWMFRSIILDVYWLASQVNCPIFGCHLSICHRCCISIIMFFHYSRLFTEHKQA